MKRLVVIAGPACSGKLPLAKTLMEKDPSLVLVHRDALRDAIVTKVDEWTITEAMGVLAAVLLEAEDSGTLQGASGVARHAPTGSSCAHPSAGRLDARDHLMGHASR